MSDNSDNESELDRLDLTTPNFTDQNIMRIAELFPNVVTESRDEDGKVKHAIDFDALKQELSDNIVEGSQECYQLNWPGKRKAMLTANAPINKTLRPCREESVDFDTTKNLFIEGDNLDALKLLQETYLGKVKMIYIDPPYNTGKDFIYKDNFSVNKDEYLEESGQRDEDGGRLVANPESNGRYHSDWLSMMYPRLKLARNLLRDDGAIFVSVDEGEQANLREILDGIFGASNFVSDLVWAAGRKNDSRLISISHEYIVCYAKNAEMLKENKVVWRQQKKGLDEIYKEYDRLCKLNDNEHDKVTDGMKRWYRGLADGAPSKAHKHFSHSDDRGLYFPDNISWVGGGGPKYDILHPITGKAVKVPSRGWMTSDPKKMESWISDRRVHFGEDETTVPCIKSYLRDKEKQTPYSVFYQDGRAASKRLKSLMGESVFNFPKDEFVLQELVEMLTTEGDTIVDFFAGSGTLAHSVLLQNAEDHLRRKFILVQISEPLKQGLPMATGAVKKTIVNAIEYTQKLGVSATISELAKARVSLASESILKENPDQVGKLDVGFRVLKIESSNMTDVWHSPDQVSQDDLLSQVSNIKPDRTAEDLLFQVLLDWGVDLTLPIARESIEGKDVFFVDENALAACFDTGVSEELVKQIAQRKPLRVVFRDDGFDSDATKINVEQLFKHLSPHTEVKVI